MPYLAAIFTKPDKSYNIHCIREFTPEQFAEYKRISAEFTILCKRFSLLWILEQNYSALDSYINNIQSSKRISAQLIIAEANRHFMNYLSSGYTLREHLEVSFKKDFGRNSEALNKFLKFLLHLEKTHFEYAFFQDFRNFVQHCGFPVGTMNLSDKKEGVLLSIKYSKAALIKDYKGWEKCGLSGRNEVEFDLIALLKGHHRVVKQEFSVVIQDQYGKTLDKIQKYFVALQNEAKNIQENAEAKIIISFPTEPSHGSLVFQEIPKNPLAELGLSRTTISGNILLLSYQVEEHERFFEVRKKDIIEIHPTMVNLDYDPFPNAEKDDIIRSAFMGRESVLYAKLQSTGVNIKPGVALELNGHKFALTKVNEHPETDGDKSIFDVEGSEYRNFFEPPQIVADMRKELAIKGS